MLSGGGLRHTLRGVETRPHYISIRRWRKNTDWTRCVGNMYIPWYLVGGARMRFEPRVQGVAVSLREHNLFGKLWAICHNLQLNAAIGVRPSLMGGFWKPKNLSETMFSAEKMASFSDKSRPKLKRGNLSVSTFFQTAILKKRQTALHASRKMAINSGISTKAGPIRGSYFNSLLWLQLIQETVLIGFVLTIGFGDLSINWNCPYNWFRWLSIYWNWPGKCFRRISMNWNRLGNRCRRPFICWNCVSNRFRVLSMNWNCLDNWLRRRVINWNYPANWFRVLAQ